MTIPKPLLALTFVFALIGIIVVYEALKPYALSFLAEQGWNFGDVSYDGSTAPAKKKAAPTYTPDWKAAEYQVSEGEWQWCFDTLPARQAKKNSTK